MCTQNSSDRSLNSKHTSQSFQVTPIRHTKYPISRNRWEGEASPAEISKTLNKLSQKKIRSIIIRFKNYFREYIMMKQILEFRLTIL